MYHHRILVRNVTSLSEARYVAGMGASIIALPITDFNNGTGVDLEKAVSIVNWISGVDILLEIPKIDEMASLVYLANKAKESGLILSGFYIKHVTNQQLNWLTQNFTDTGFLYFFEIDETFTIKGSKNMFIIRSRENSHITEVINENQFIEVNNPKDFDPDLIKKFGGVVLNGTPETVTGLHNFDNLEAIFVKLESI